MTIDTLSLVPVAVATWKEETEVTKRPDRAKELERENTALKEEIKHRDRLIEEHEKFKDIVEHGASSLKEALTRLRTSSATSRKGREKSAIPHP